jgi:cell division protein ZapA
MAQIKIEVNGRSYRMGCRDGEEARVQTLAAEINKIVHEMRGANKLVPDDRLFLMAAIMMADQLWDTRDELQRALKQLADFRAYQVIDGGSYVAPRDVSRLADHAAQRLEAMSVRGLGADHRA